MSQQILKYHKPSTKINNEIFSINKNNKNEVHLSKIMNPLSTKTLIKQQKFDITQKKYNIGQKVKQQENLQRLAQKPINPNKKQTENKEQNKLNKYSFQTDLNTSSQDQCIRYNQSQNKKFLLQRKVSQQFKNSKKQIESLLQQSTSKKDRKYQQKKKIDDQKGNKRKKLSFFCCDSIVVKPQDKDINNIKERGSEDKSGEQIFNGEQRWKNKRNIQESRVQIQSITELNKRELKKKWRQEAEIETVPFKKQKENMRNTQFKEDTVYSKSLKSINCQRKDAKNSTKGSLNGENEEGQSDSSKSKQADQNLNENLANLKGKNQVLNENIIILKKRNKIFDNSKKYGLKLSRVIKQEQEVSRLQGEMGIDFFHIIIQEEEILRQCCS